MRNSAKLSVKSPTKKKVIPHCEEVSTYLPLVVHSQRISLSFSLFFDALVKRSGDTSLSHSVSEVDSVGSPRSTPEKPALAPEQPPAAAAAVAPTTSAAAAAAAAAIAAAMNLNGPVPPLIPVTSMPSLPPPPPPTLPPTVSASGPLAPPPPPGGRPPGPPIKSYSDFMRSLAAKYNNNE